MIVTNIHYSVNDINKLEWNALVSQEEIFQTYDALSFFEKKGLVDYPPVYIIFRDEKNQMLAHTTAYIIKTDLLIFSRGILKKGVEQIRRLFPNFLKFDILECGCPISPGSPISLRNKSDLSNVINLLANALDILAKERSVNLMLIRDFYETNDDYFCEFTKENYVAIDNLPTTLLNIRWGSFEQYVSTMRNRYRSKIYRGLKIAKASNLSVEFSKTFSSESEELSLQWQNVSKNAKEYSREHLTSDFYKYIGNGLNQQCLLLRIMRNQDMVAHALLAIDNKKLRWLFFGRKEEGSRDGAYFLAIANIVKFAIDNDFHSIEMGLTTYSPKTDFGASMVPLWMYLKCRHKSLNFFIPKMYAYFNKKVNVNVRKVFK